MKYVSLAVVLVIVSSSLRLSSVFAGDDLPLRIAHLEKSLTSIEREEAAVARKDGDGNQSNDDQARKARTEMLLAEIRRNIAVTIADLRDDDRPGAEATPRNRTTKARANNVNRRVVRHSRSAENGIAEEPKEIEVQVVVDSDARKPKPVDRKSRIQSRREARPGPPERRGRRGAEATSTRSDERPSREAERQYGHVERYTPSAGRPELDGNQVHVDRRVPSALLRAAPPRGDRAQHLRAAATHLDAAGYESMAKKARAEADRLAREARRSDAPGHRPGAGVPAHVVRVGNAIKELRRDVDKLRKEMAALKKHAGEMGKEHRASGREKAERSRKAKEAASKKKMKDDKKRSEIEQKKRKKELEEKRKLERKRRENELKKKRKAQR